MPSSPARSTTRCCAWCPARPARRCCAGCCSPSCARATWWPGTAARGRCRPRCGAASVDDIDDAARLLPTSVPLSAFSYAMVTSVADARRAAGVQHPGRHRRPRVRHQRLRQPQHRVETHAAGHGDAAGHRRGHRRLPGQLRRPGQGADDPAGADPEPAGQRVRGHRGRHGHQDPAAQPAGDRRGRAVVPGQPGGRRGHDARGAAGDRQGARLPDLRPDRRSAGDPGRVPHRSRIDPDARGGRGRGGPARAGPAWSSPSCRTR